MTMRS